MSVTPSTVDRPPSPAPSPETVAAVRRLLLTRRLQGVSPEAVLQEEVEQREQALTALAAQLTQEMQRVTEQVRIQENGWIQAIAGVNFTRASSAQLQQSTSRLAQARGIQQNLSTNVSVASNTVATQEQSRATLLKVLAQKKHQLPLIPTSFSQQGKLNEIGEQVCVSIATKRGS